MLGLRVVDRYRTHWQLCLQNTAKYALHPVPAGGDGADGWTTVRVDLLNPAPHQWRAFESDGNPLYHTGSPDFSGLAAVVVECGAGYPGTAVAVPGSGVFELADFVVDTQPPGTPPRPESAP